MAAVHYGRLLGPIGFARTVAIKRLHAGIASDPDNAAMFLDEARLSARIHHPNVVPTIDVIEHGSELLLVMDYVAGPSLGALVKLVKLANETIPPEHAVSIVLGVLHGLHAAHEAKGTNGEPLAIVHRDVSPQNILVGDDGVARLIDFGIAKAVERVHQTRGNEIRGKLLYMSPEQISRRSVDRRTDIYAISVVLWELLTGRRIIDLGQTEDPVSAIQLVKNHVHEPVSRHVPEIAPELDALVSRGLSAEPSQRFATALEMATALEAACSPSSQREVAEWVKRVAAELLAERAKALRELETSTESSPFVQVAISMAPPAAPSSRATFTLVPDGNTGKAWAQTDPPKKKFDARPFALAAGVVAVVVAWIAGTHRGTVSVQSVPPTQQPAVVAPPPAVEPAAAPPPSVAPTAEVEVPAPAPKPSATHKPIVRPKSKCDPPYTIDAKGIKVPKPECR